MHRACHLSSRPTGLLVTLAVLASCTSAPPPGTRPPSPRPKAAGSPVPSGPTTPVVSVEQVTKLSDQELLGRLDDFAAVTAVRSSLLSAGQVPGILSNGGAGLVSNGGGRLVSNGGGRLVSNGGAGVVSNGGGNLVSNGGGAVAPGSGTRYVWPGGSRFGLLQAADDGLSLGLLPGEAVVVSRLYPDGTSYLGTRSGARERTVIADAEGRLLFALEVNNLELHPGGSPARSRTRRRFFGEKGLVSEADQIEKRDPMGRVRAVEVVRTSAVNELTGWPVEIVDTVFDLDKQEGRYKVRFPALDIEEEGRVTATTFDVPRDEPLLTLQGEAVVRRLGGEELFRKRSDDIGLWYELADGLQILVRERAGSVFEGELLHRSSRRGKVVIDRLAPRKGTLGITLTLGEDRYEAVVRGGKVAFEAARPGATPAPTPTPTQAATPGPGALRQWLVHTLMELPGANLFGLVFGRPGRVFLLDREGPTLLAVDMNSWTVEAALGPTPPRYPIGRHLQQQLGDVTRLYGTDNGRRIFLADQAGISEVRGPWLENPSGGDISLTRLVGGATPGHRDGPKASALFNAPLDHVTLPDGTMFVLDSGNHVVRRVTSAGEVDTLAGLPGTPGEADGTGSQARFQLPLCLALLPTGDLVVADSGNRRLCRVTQAGVVTTLAGGGKEPVRDGSAAGFGAIFAMTADPAGSIYLAELLGGRNSALRRVSPGGETAGSLAGGFSVRGEDGASVWAGLDTVTGLAVAGSGPTLLFVEPQKLRLAFPAEVVLTPQPAPAGPSASP